MPTLLRLDSSADLDGSRTRAMTEAFAQAWLARGSDHRVVTRDLHATPLPHLRTPAQHWPERLREGATVPADLDVLQQEVLAEFLAADAVVIGAPMYNYSMPATLKTWIDMIHIPGLTAPFDTDTQPMKDRTAVVVSARGATYGPGEPTEGWDHAIPPLRIVLGDMLGMRVEVVTVDRTLADRVPPLDPALAAEEFEAGLARSRRLAASI